MNLKEVKEIINLLQNSDIDELEIEREGVRIRVKKTPGVQHVPVISTNVPSQIFQQPVPVISVPVAPQNGGQTGQAQGTAPAEKGVIQIVSPMVGTFYRAPSSEAEPYVEVGTEVAKGQPLCIIEAMKMMNEIECEVSGKIVRILVENGQTVEYGQPLFQVESSV